MLPFNECDRDPVRDELDAELLTKVLGIQDIGILTSMQTLRAMLCAEPSIHGGKKSKCNLDAELAKLKLKVFLSQIGILMSKFAMYGEIQIG